MSYHFTVRQHCLAIEHAEFHVTLPQPPETYIAQSGGDYEDLTDVLRAAVGGDIEGAETVLLSTHYRDDPVGDYNEWDEAGAVDWPAPTPADLHPPITSRSPLGEVEALSLAIFALNTLAHPDASSEGDMDVLEARTGDTIQLLTRMRDKVVGAGDVPLPRHDCGLCDGPLRFDGYEIRDGQQIPTWRCTDPTCDAWHTSYDCCVPSDRMVRVVVGLGDDRRQIDIETPRDGPFVGDPGRVYIEAPDGTLLLGVDVHHDHLSVGTWPDIADNPDDAEWVQVAAVSLDGSPFTGCANCGRHTSQRLCPACLAASLTD